LLPCRSGAVAAYQEAEAVAEPFQDLRKRERRHAGGREFEREGQAFQARAERGD
jgi:hypothetical protein